MQGGANASSGAKGKLAYDPIAIVMLKLGSNPAAAAWRRNQATVAGYGFCHAFGT